ncbi:MAG: Gfo/Idh/MocA family oxidoreductase [Anaerolineae bacterium]|nr:Gfo/Idh/MocA family oxidoreductase [Anaerolineae bacterium]
MAETRIGLGIIGCGNIANAYARALAAAPEVVIVGYTDLQAARAEVLAEQYGGRVYADLDGMLADERIKLVVNLTIHHAHYEVTRRCLEAARHVYSEKPLAMTTAEARALVALARQQGMRLAGAPISFLGEAQQTAWKVIREGRLGTARVAYAEADWGRIESWHPAPEPFYEVGPLFDVGVYPLTLLTTIFGPASRVSAYETILLPERMTKDGKLYRIHTPDFMVVVVEFAEGSVARLTTNFYVSQKTQDAGIAFHGDAGSLYLGHWFLSDAKVAFAPYGEPYEPVPLVRETPPGVQWERGIVDLVQAIREERRQRVTGEQAAHVVEIICAAHEAAEGGGAVPVVSTFTPPAPMDWAA